MSDDALPPRAGAQPPEGPGDGFGPAPTPRIDLDKGATGGAPAEPGPWAPPANDAGPGQGPGETVVSGPMPPWPGPSVHDQQTVTSLPSPGDDPAPSPWAAPAANPAPDTGGPFAAPGGPATPSAPVPNPFAAPEDRPSPPPGPAAGAGHVPYGYPPGPAYPGGPAYPAQGGYGSVPAQGYYGWTGMPPEPSNGMGTAGLVLGIISAVIFCHWPVTIILGVLGIIFGSIGRAKAARGEADNGGQALAGLICGIVGVVLSCFGAVVSIL
ncbi:DUF4190 domain-containing protein [Streptomyces sp. AD55]|uniref:DUF4190 domain-containing protein n=1 Tax=Streptomyces sp. AD55 TaxID=3242895 RepID=UPI003529C7AF